MIVAQAPGRDARVLVVQGSLKRAASAARSFAWSLSDETAAAVASRALSGVQVTGSESAVFIGRAKLHLTAFDSYRRSMRILDRQHAVSSRHSRTQYVCRTQRSRNVLLGRVRITPVFPPRTDGGPHTSQDTPASGQARWSEGQTLAVAPPILTRYAGTNDPMTMAADPETIESQPLHYEPSRQNRGRSLGRPIGRTSTDCSFGL